MIHETFLRDVVDVINSVKDFDEVEWIKNKNKLGSIAKRASNLILVFPVVVSNSLSIQTASLISKAIERKCVALLRILFASINMTSMNSLEDYISQFHTNISKGLTMDEFITVVDKLSEAGEIEISDRDAYEMVKEDMKNINFYLSTALNEVSLNDYECYTNRNGELNITPKKIQLEGNVTDIKQAADDLKKMYATYNARERRIEKDLEDIIPKAMDTVDAAWEDITRVQKANALQQKELRDANNALRKQLKVTADKLDNRAKADAKASLKDTVDYFTKQLLPQDVAKANELMPTLVTVNFTTVDTNSGVKNTATGIIGVKAKLYPVDSMEIITRISSKYSTNNTLFNLVRASTREISFFKDFAFAIDKAKIDAINMAKKSDNSSMFKLLERRATKNKFSSLLKKNDASPITSLVLSQEEVEYLKKYHNTDMEKSYITRTILESYNLMDIVIADESLEVARFLFDDGDGIFETMTFDSLEKEAKDSSYKKVINLMSKINR
jgi:hypothetical protein